MVGNHLPEHGDDLPEARSGFLKDGRQFSAGKVLDGKFFRLVSCARLSTTGRLETVLFSRVEARITLALAVMGAV